MALRLEGDLVSAITGFGDPGLFSVFDLPAVIVEPFVSVPVGNCHRHRDVHALPGR
jgi:hypothetical protein